MPFPQEDGVCDLTNEHLHSLESVQLSPQLRVLDLTANRLSSIDPRILALTGSNASSCTQARMPFPLLLL